MSQDENTVLEKRKPGRPRNEDALIPARILLLDETIKTVAEHGPLVVSARQICKAAGVMFAAVNYNFGSWNGLLATAAAKVYREFFENTWAAVQSAPREPEARLREYIRQHMIWNTKMAGWSALVNFPVLVKDVTAMRLELFSEETIDHFLLNQARLQQLITDVRQNQVHDFEYTAANLPIDELIKQEPSTSQTVSIGWSIMGMAIWAARGETGAAQVGQFQKLQPRFVEYHINQLIQTIKTSA